MMRWVWPVMILVISAVVAAAQIDRQSRRSPDLARAAPQAIRGFAHYHHTASLLEQGDTRAGLRAAQRLVAARPMPEENLRLYAQAQLLAGNRDRAALAFQLAARHGWRDPVAQEVQLRLAMAAGDGAEAGRRLAGLWAISPDKAKLAELSPLVLQDLEARSAFAQVLADSPRWNRRFNALGPAILPARLFEEIRRDARFN